MNCETPNFSLIPDLFKIGKFFLVDTIPAGNGTDLTDVYRERAYDTHCSLVPSLEGCKSDVLIFGKESLCNPHLRAGLILLPLSNYVLDL